MYNERDYVFIHRKKEFADENAYYIHVDLNLTESKHPHSAAF